MEPKLETEQKTESKFETRYCRTCKRDTEHVRVDSDVSRTGHQEIHCMECLTWEVMAP